MISLDLFIYCLLCFIVLYFSLTLLKKLVRAVKTKNKKERNQCIYSLVVCLLVLTFLVSFPLVTLYPHLPF